MNPLLDLGTHPVIGHRGASGLAPENTLEALDLALKQGADGLEFDVHLSVDGSPVLMHDPRLDRTTSGSGLVRGRTAAELATLDAGYRFTADEGLSFPWRDRGLGVPALATVLERFPETPLLVELKTVEVADPVRRLLLETGARERVVLASFHEAALAPFRGEGFHTAASRRAILGLWLGSSIGLGARAPQDQVYAVPDRYRERIPVPTRRFIRAARKAGCPVHVWTVNDPERAVVLWRQGVCGIITNLPGLLVTERNRIFPEEGPR